MHGISKRIDLGWVEICPGWSFFNGASMRRRMLCEFVAVDLKLFLFLYVNWMRIFHWFFQCAVKKCFKQKFSASDRKSFNPIYMRHILTKRTVKSFQNISTLAHVSHTDKKKQFPKISNGVVELLRSHAGCITIKI